MFSLLNSQKVKITYDEPMLNKATRDYARKYADELSLSLDFLLKMYNRVITDDGEGIKRILESDTILTTANLNVFDETCRFQMLFQHDDELPKVIKVLPSEEG